jgi:hypothetical protein
MKHLPKDVQKLSDEQLADQLFPKEALDKIKADLETAKPKCKPRTAP